jgi:uncharacterized protein YbjT (DUF2867 family)
MTAGLLLLTGANGRTGRAILSSLVDHNVPVRAMVRNPAHLEPLRALGATETVVADMTDPAALRTAMQGAAKVLHIGPPMHPQELEITTSMIEAAQSATIEHFIYYSVMHPQSRAIRHHRLKSEAEEVLIDSGLAYTIVQPSRYMQHLLPIWPQVKSEGVHAMPFSIERKFNLVDLLDLAEACAIIAASSAHHHAIYELAGPEALSQRDMAAIIADVLGRPVTARAISFEDLAARAAANGASADRVEQMVRMNRHYDAHGFRGNPNILEYLIGRPAGTFRAYVKRLAAA